MKEVTEMPKAQYCGKCGLRMKTIPFVSSYDKETGEKIFRWKYVCPRPYLFRHLGETRIFNSAGEELINYSY
jgi:hypothetical protein